MINLINELKCLNKYTDEEQVIRLENLKDLIEVKEIYIDSIQDIVDLLVKISVSAVNADLQETSLSLAVDLLTFNTIDCKLNLDLLESKINKIHDIALESAIFLFGFSKNIKYAKILNYFLAEDTILNTSAAEALTELEYSTK